MVDISEENEWLGWYFPARQIIKSWKPGLSTMGPIPYLISPFEQGVPIRLNWNSSSENGRRWAWNYIQRRDYSSTEALALRHRKRHVRYDVVRSLISFFLIVRFDVLNRFAICFTIWFCWFSCGHYDLISFEFMPDGFVCFDSFGWCKSKLSIRLGISR